MAENDIYIKIKAQTEEATLQLQKFNKLTKAALEIPTGALDHANSSVNQWIDHLKRGSKENVEYSKRIAAITLAYKEGGLSADQARTQLERIRAEMERANVPVKQATLNWKEFVLGAGAVIAVSKQVVRVISGEIER